MSMDVIGRTMEFLRFRSRDYKLTFNMQNPSDVRVLMDLNKFCRGNETCFDADPRKHAVLEGRREVWLRITNHLHLSSEQLFALYTGNEYGAMTNNRAGEDNA